MWLLDTNGWHACMDALLTLIVFIFLYWYHKIPVNIKINDKKWNEMILELIEIRNEVKERCTNGNLMIINCRDIAESYLAFITTYWYLLQSRLVRLSLEMEYLLDCRRFNEWPSMPPATLFSIKLTSPWTKWPPFHRRYFQIHFPEWNIFLYHRIDDESSSERMLTRFTDVYMRTMGRWVNPSLLCAAFMRHPLGSALVQIRTSLSPITKPWSEPVLGYCQLDH